MALAQGELYLEWEAFLERVLDRPWVSLIEFALIGTVVYTILRFLQGTRGARLVRAVLAILAVSFAVVWLIAERYEFSRIDVLYPYFVFGVFAVSLVAFQTELRRMLMRLGEGGVLQRLLMRQQSNSIDAVTRAVDRMSKKKIGALIAIERGTEMGAIVETGVTVDAAVSAELLETIFWPGTPLHDLGVVVRGQRVLAAGCQFPLAESGELDRTLGSRHLAALGVSQETDSVVVVVSEETGTVSIALGGRLRRGFSAETLRETLAQLLGARAASPETAEALDEAKELVEAERG